MTGGMNQCYKDNNLNTGDPTTFPRMYETWCIAACTTYTHATLMYRITDVGRSLDSMCPLTMSFDSRRAVGLEEDRRPPIRQSSRYVFAPPLYCHDVTSMAARSHPASQVQASVEPGIIFCKDVIWIVEISSGDLKQCWDLGSMLPSPGLRAPSRMPEVYD